MTIDGTALNQALKLDEIDTTRPVPLDAREKHVLANRFRELAQLMGPEQYIAAVVALVEEFESHILEKHGPDHEALVFLRDYRAGRL